MTKVIETRGLEELQQRFKMYPVRWAQTMSTTMAAVLLTLQEKTPGYPPPPSSSNYRRTGTLGRTLGVSEGGGRIGQPTIFKIRKYGGGNFEGRYGTNLNYAPYVIGSRGTQSSFFGAYWWQLDSVIGIAYQKIKSLFNTAAQELAAFLDKQ